MRGRSLVVLALFLIATLASKATAQAVYAAHRSSSIEAGAGLLYLSTDYSDSVQGVSAWADYNFNRTFGVEVVGHLGTIRTPADIAEKSILVGPRVAYHHGKAGVFGTFSFGSAQISNQLRPNYDDAYANFSRGNYFVYAFGGGIEYHLNHKINLRPFVVEIQKWPDFEPHTLSPIALTFGASYIIR